MYRCLLPVVVVALCAAFSTQETMAEADRPLDFARDVRPILAERCFACHGFDEEHREADLRLDVPEADDATGASLVIEAGDPEASALFERVTESDPDLRMPPPEAGEPLTAEEIATLRQWIDEGASYDRHWAWVAPERPAAPETSREEWVETPVDAFIADRLAEAGLEPSERADKATLLRRLSLDLIGLPPTPEELAGYLAMPYDEVVETLLASEHYGERWGRLWLDAARYADSDGFEKDKPRSVWMYRDWVVAALNADMPYDQFIVRQLAGDLLPDATQDDWVATGFLRNSMNNEEGGIDPEQFRMEAMYDRMDAIGKGMLGLTLQCARCHTHKYDPLTQTEYYEMFAFINNSYEGSIAAYPPEELRQRDHLLAEIAAIEERLKRGVAPWRQELVLWEEQLAEQSQTPWTIVRPELDGSGGQKHYLLEDGSILAAGYSPPRHTTDFSVEVKAPTVRAVRLELLNHPDLPLGGPGRSPWGTFALSEFELKAAPLDGSSPAKQVKIAAASSHTNPPERPLEEGYASEDREGFTIGPAELAIDGKESTAWTDDRGPGRSNVPCEAVFVLEEPIQSESGVRLTFQLKQVHGSNLGNTIYNKNLGRFRFSVTGAENPAAAPVPKFVAELLEIPASHRTDATWAALFSYWRTTRSEWEAENQQIEQLWQQHPRGASQLVLRERETQRATHRLERGEFLNPAERVLPGTPSMLHPLETDAPDRLAFARWVADRKSPTTARAMVNRIWQAYFGAGLVRTADDLGVQGDLPTHPRLLDWLAVELMDNDWSLKHLHRKIVHSAVYQQTSRVTEELLARDPENRLLARGPRFRVDAEVVRDLALTASGLLTRTLGGPSVYPPAPEFIFQPPASYGDKTWFYDEGSDKYRRALYTFRYRSVPYPALEAFDAPNGDVSCVRRSRSNTPLQALVTLNEPLFLECAQALAARSYTEATSDESRLQDAARRCLSREFDSDEAASLAAFLERQRSHFASHPDAAQQLGSSPHRPEEVPEDEFAAWTIVARVILNLDETLTKE